MVQGTGHRQGRSFPLGATVYPDGVNFSVFSRYGTVLANIKLIAEAWDAAGLYQVGRFPGES